MRQTDSSCCSCVPVKQPNADHPSLLLCATPETSGPVAGVLRKRTLLAVVQTVGGFWWRVRWHNREAW